MRSRGGLGVEAGALGDVTPRRGLGEGAAEQKGSNAEAPLEGRSDF